MNDVMIEAKEIYKHFGKVKALDGVSQSIKRGEVVVIIGPSGSGKSTFLRCLNHLEKIDRGSIIIDNIPLTDSKTNIYKVREEIGMVFQQFNLFPHLTVLRNITLAQIKVRKRSHQEAERIARNLLTRWASPKRRTTIPSSSQEASSRAWPCSPRHAAQDHALR
jgi:polar amino acid transport system ATP-binding protein